MEVKEITLLQILNKQAALLFDLNKRVKALEEKRAPTESEQEKAPSDEKKPFGMADLLRELFGADNVTETTREGAKIFSVGKKDGTCDCFVCRPRKASEQKEDKVGKGKTQE